MYRGKKWDKEIKELEKNIKDMGRDYVYNRLQGEKIFERNGNNDYLQLYFSLGNDFFLRACDKYLLDMYDGSIVKDIYMSGISILITRYLFSKGIRSYEAKNKVIEHNSEILRYQMCFRFLAVDQMPKLILETEADRPIIMLYNRDYDGLRNVLSALPDDPDDSREVYYEETVFLKKIYLAILDKDEKAFNEEIENRIKKYRRNMVGYSTIIDYVSIALIKLAEREGIHCNVDVIEIPKQFFDKELLDNLDIHELSHYDELMKTGMLDGFELD